MRASALPRRGVLTAVSITPDGSLAISAGNDGTANVWDLDVRTSKAPLSTSMDRVLCTALTPDARIAILGGPGGKVEIWDPWHGVLLDSFAREQSADVNSVAITPDGSRLLAGCGPGCPVIVVWDILRRTVLSEFRGHDGSVAHVCVSADGRYALSAGEFTEHAIHVWDVERCERIKVFDVHALEVTGLCLTPDARFALSACRDKTLRLWDIHQGVQSRSQQRHADAVVSLAWISNRRQLASAGALNDGTVRFWDIASGECCKVVKAGPEPWELLATTPNQRIQVWRDDRTAFVVADALTHSTLGRFEGHSAYVHGAAVDTNGRVVVSASADKTLRVWDVERRVCNKVLEGHQDAVRCVSLAHGTHLAVSGSADKTLRLWDLDHGVCKRTLEGHTHTIVACALCPNGSYVLSAGWDESVRLWEVASGRCVGVAHIEGGVIVLSQWTDDDRVAYGTRSGDVGILELRNL